MTNRTQNPSTRRVPLLKSSLKTIIPEALAYISSYGDEGGV